MDKSPDAFRTISEVAEEMDLPQHVLRFWETRFPQIKPLKRGGGRRYYRPEDVALLRAVKQLLYGEGYTIKGVQKLLREQGAGGLVKGAAREAPAAPPDGRVEAASPAPIGPDADAEVPGKGVEPRLAPAPTASARAPASFDLTALRAIHAELREAERVLAQARAV
jgi:DNA-binding transcriptional MerR regulator